MTTALSTRLSPMSIALFLAVGCGATTTQLHPALKANGVPGMPDAAEAQIEQVRIVAQGDAWPGRPEILQHVTPMRLRIENAGNLPIALRYRDFSLVGADGRRTYAALPPFDVRGEISTPEVAYTSFDTGGFAVAPYYGSMYPGIDVWGGGPFPYDASYSPQFTTYYERHPLPTREMVARGLPEGVIAPGGHVDGFLYFEHVPADAGRVVLLARVETPNGEPLGQAAIPFRVGG